MRRIDEIVEQARRLTLRERKALLARLRLRPRRVAARVTKKRTGGDRATKRPFAALLALTGRFHIDATDVSSDKYKHLAEIYADQT